MAKPQEIIGLAVGKEMFFDRKEVIAALGRANVKVLSRFGAFVRTTARQSIKKIKGKVGRVKKRKYKERDTKGVSPPGSPPASHRGTLKRGIAFGYDLSKRSVLIGPRPFSGTVTPASLRALEHGGPSLVRRKDGSKESINIRARPFMGPAFQKELPGFPALWADSVK